MTQQRTGNAAYRRADWSRGELASELGRLERTLLRTERDLERAARLLEWQNELFAAFESRLVGVTIRVDLGAGEPSERHE